MTHNRFDRALRDLIYLDDANALEGIGKILAERRRQIEAKGFDRLHDDTHSVSHLASLAEFRLPMQGQHTSVKDLAEAGALAAAAIDRSYLHVEAPAGHESCERRHPASDETGHVHPGHAGMWVRPDEPRDNENAVPASEGFPARIGLTQIHQPGCAYGSEPHRGICLDPGPIRHGQCVAASIGFTDGHTHEGETGWWRFAVVVSP